MKSTGKVTGIVSNLVTVECNGPVSQNEICYITVGDTKLMAEVIKVNGNKAAVQVFESTRGLKNGNEVEFEARMLEATLGPGLLSSCYDGLQNDLTTMTGVFLKKGEYTDPLNHEKLWDFTPIAKPGDKVVAADWLGEVKEGWLPHKIMVPFAFKGEYTVKSIVEAGEYNIDKVVAVLTNADGEDVDVTMTQKWPVKVAIKGYKEKPRPSRIMETGVRVIDTLDPIAEGGTGFIPGPFGCGKTVLQHAISKQAEADIVISMNHFKGHEQAGFGGTLKNLGMGSGSVAGKEEMHATAQPMIKTENCIGCRLCEKHCAHDAVHVIDGKAVIELEKCVGCGQCSPACPQHIDIPHTLRKLDRYVNELKKN